MSTAKPSLRWMLPRDWPGPMGVLRSGGGCEMVNWFNFADRSMFPDYEHGGAYSPKSTDVLLDGFFLRLTYKH